jgi:hypothetical protein
MHVEREATEDNAHQRCRPQVEGLHSFGTDDIKDELVALVNPLRRTVAATQADVGTGTDFLYRAVRSEWKCGTERGMTCRQMFER